MCKLLCVHEQMRVHSFTLVLDSSQPSCGNVCNYLNLFQEIPEDQRAVANILKDFPKDLQPVELLRVTGAYFLELLEGRWRVSS